MDGKDERRHQGKGTILVEVRRSGQISRVEGFSLNGPSRIVASAEL